jgi:hypothetical protein
MSFRRCTILIAGWLVEWHGELHPEATTFGFVAFVLILGGM